MHNENAEVFIHGQVRFSVSIFRYDGQLVRLLQDSYCTGGSFFKFPQTFVIRKKLVNRDADVRLKPGHQKCALQVFQLLSCFFWLVFVGS